MSLPSGNIENKGSGKHKLQHTYSKAVQEERSTDDANPCKNTCTEFSITNLPDDCLSHVYKRLKSSTDHSSFGLVCRHWLHIQDNNQKSLWGKDNLNSCLRNSPKISPQNFSIILCRLLIRFKNLKRLSLSGLPEVTDHITSQSQFFGSKVEFLCLKGFSSDKNLSLIYSSFSRLASVRMSSSHITDKDLEVLAKSCASLETINISSCQEITDLGISFLIKNCFKLQTVRLPFCNRVTGIGFLGCPKTLTHVDAVYMHKLTTEGIKAIASGGGLQYLYLSGNAVNNEAVITISKGCSLLKLLSLESCLNLLLEGWEAIGLYCRNLEYLSVVGCPMLCDQGLKALCYGCNKLSYLRMYKWSDFARKFFEQERPNVLLLSPTNQ